MGLFDKMKMQMAKQALKTMLKSNNPQVLDLIASHLPKELAANVGQLKSLFDQKGLGHLVDSWTGPGPKIPMSPEQVKEILGSDKLALFSQQIDMPADEMAQLISTWLPALVERMSKKG